MSSALCVFIHASETGHAGGVPIAPSRGRSVEFPSKGNLYVNTLVRKKVQGINVKLIKVHVKTIHTIVSKHMINVLLKIHYKDCELTCGVGPLNHFAQFLCSGFFGLA